MITTTKIALPEFGGETLRPELPVQVYQARLAAAAAGTARLGLDLLAVFADREHCANISYLTGFDPRFEESLLLLDARGPALLLVGNECLGCLPDPRLGLKVELFQDFSLLGQPRQSSRPLREILAGFGVGPKTKVGCVGFKTYDPRLTADARYATDLPAYLVDLLRDLAGAPDRVVNAAGLFTNPTDGLRIVDAEPEQIAAFEYAAQVTSLGVLDVLRHFREGVREDELEKYLDSRGLPLACHRTIRFGEKAKRSLTGPSPNRAALGDTFSMSFGVIGSLTARAGALVHEPNELPAALRDFYPRFAANYFEVVAAWYEQLRVGAVAGEVFLAVNAARDDHLFRFALNPGHCIHLDEWVNSPFAAASPVCLRSGMVLQADLIPVSQGPYCYANVEDGIVLADDKLRAALAARFPALCRRVEARRNFMAQALGIKLHESVLPLSNMPACLSPYALTLEQRFVKE
jgi:hypothetical protein